MTDKKKEEAVEAKAGAAEKETKKKTAAKKPKKETKAAEPKKAAAEKKDAKPKKETKATAKKTTTKKSAVEKKAESDEKVVVEHKASKLTDLKKVMEKQEASSPAVAAPAAEKQEQGHRVRIDEQGRSYATGRRKSSVARVWIKRGNGQIKVNGREFATYFARPALQNLIVKPFQVANRDRQYDVIATVSGGGLSGQAGAMRLGISRALSNVEPELRKAIKSEGLLTRDARVVERKKYGLRKARAHPQFSKR